MTSKRDNKKGGGEGEGEDVLLLLLFWRHVTFTDARNGSLTPTKIVG